MSTILGKLVNNRLGQKKDLMKESIAMVGKWEKTGLLEGLDNKKERQDIARLLENQAEELLREATTMSNGDVEGFASVAFPLVRRVFGELLAENLVSVQPMSLPAGLIFFLDFTYANDRAGIYAKGDSVYGGGVVGKDITQGVEIDDLATGFYYNQNGYSSPFSLSEVTITGIAGVTPGDNQAVNPNWSYGAASSAAYTAANIETQNTETDVNHDVEVLNDGGLYSYRRYTIQLSQANWDRVDLNAVMGVNLLDDAAGTDLINTATCTVLRRLTSIDTVNRRYTLVVRALVANAADLASCSAGGTNYLAFPLNDRWANSSTLGALVGDDWRFEGPDDKYSKYGVGASSAEEWQEMPEIDIKINSVSITATTKKLKAKWSPELGQDLSAYHNLDAEVELTGILSEHIALEIDREILSDLLSGGTAGKLYWSRRPGIFVNRTTGQVLSVQPDFTGNVSEWYQTLLEVINDLSATIHRKTLRGGANFIVCGPELAAVLEFTAGFKASIAAPEQTNATAGSIKTGTISKKWDIFVDPYFPRNAILVGRKGSSFLESGYVYSPYVPLQVTPVVHGVEDFTPRKGVSTRYAKKMVKPDHYGIVIVRHLRN